MLTVDPAKQSTPDLPRATHTSESAGASIRCWAVRAAVCSRYGSPQVVQLDEVPIPAVGVGQLRVAVHATTVNRTDCGMRSGRPLFVRTVTGPVRPRFRVLGNEFAGIVESVGAGVTRFRVGERVFGYSRRFGAHAELLVVQQDGMVTTVPDGLSFQDVVAGTEGAHYALSIIWKAGIGAGQDVLVNGATGAIGSAAVQLLADLGARAIAVSAGQHTELVTRLGAERVIDRDSVDFTTDSDRYDVVFDAVGKSSFGRCRPLLRPKGLYVTTDLGPGFQNIVLPALTRLSRGRRAMLPLPIENQEILGYLRERIASGQFSPLVDRTYSLEQIVDAYRYVETGQKIGNVVITMPTHG